MGISRKILPLPSGKLYLLGHTRRVCQQLVRVDLIIQYIPIRVKVKPIPRPRIVT